MSWGNLPYDASNSGLAETHVAGNEADFGRPGDENTNDMNCGPRDVVGGDPDYFCDSQWQIAGTSAFRGVQVSEPAPLLY